MKLQTYAWHDITPLDDGNRSSYILPGDLVRHRRLDTRFRYNDLGFGVVVSRAWVEDQSAMQVTVVWTVVPKSTS